MFHSSHSVMCSVMGSILHPGELKTLTLAPSLNWVPGKGPRTVKATGTLTYRLVHKNLSASVVCWTRLQAWRDPGLVHTGEGDQYRTDKVPFSHQGTEWWIQ
ncbi:hypothetical protein BsWGS_25663 [Bradybaena similaris]